MNVNYFLVEKGQGILLWEIFFWGGESGETQWKMFQLNNLSLISFGAWNKQIEHNSSPLSFSISCCVFCAHNVTFVVKITLYIFTWWKSTPKTTQLCNCNIFTLSKSHLLRWLIFRFLHANFLQYFFLTHLNVFVNCCVICISKKTLLDILSTYWRMWFV